MGYYDGRFIIFFQKRTLEIQNNNLKNISFKRPIVDFPENSHYKWNKKPDFFLTDNLFRYKAHCIRKVLKQ